MNKLNTFIMITLTSCLIFWAAGFAAFNVHVRGLPQATNGSTDAIIVLTGGPDRINRGLDLLAAKKARYLFISGVNTKVSQEQLIDMWRPESTNAPCCIILGHEARNTAENATEAKDWIDMNNIDSVRLLTTNYHMPRALLEFKHILPDLAIYTYALVPTKQNWPLVIAEYNKTLYTLAKLKIFTERKAS